MENTTTTTAQFFLTDYASYNNGTQFEFGHWVDLSQFSDAEELNEYIVDHFAECDEKSPLPCGSKREETMITDYEGFPEEFYSESGCDWGKIFKYIEIDWENLDDSGKISLWNEYCSEQNNEDEIYSFDDEFFEVFFNNQPMKAAQAASFGNVNWSDNYIKFNGYGNLESLNDYEAVNSIDESVLIDWLIDNK
jgi:hypothetical protein